MRRPRGIGALGALDQAGALVRATLPSVGVLWLTALPARLALLALVLTVARLGPGASQYGTALRARAGLYVALWLVSLVGRQLYIRACRTELGQLPPRPWALVRVPLADLAAQAQIAVLLEVLFWCTLPSFVLALPVIALAGLGAVTAPFAGPGWWRPVSSLTLEGGMVPLVVIGSGMLLGVGIALVNVMVLGELLVWLAGGVAGLDVAAWGRLVSWGNGTALGLGLVGAVTVVEPFWLAALTALVHHERAWKAGDDLRDRLRHLPPEAQALPSTADATTAGSPTATAPASRAAAVPVGAAPAPRGSA